MEFRQIQYFLAICKYRNISHAAKAIHLSQQALSKQIHELEEELGVSLFIRSTKGVELTRYAQKLEAPARQMLAKRDEIVQMIEDMKKEEVTHLRIGFIHGGFNPYGVISTKSIFDWEQQYHPLEVDVFERLPSALEEMLEQEELDLAVTIDGRANPPLQSQPALSEKTGFDGAGVHPVQQSEPGDAARSPYSGGSAPAAHFDLPV